jgi:hypothetical protein
MERLTWDIHQVLRDLENLPGVLLISDPAAVPHPLDQPPTPHHDTHNGVQVHTAAHRRALRRLDRALQQLELELQNGQQQVHQQEAPFQDPTIEQGESDAQQQQQQQLDQDPSQTQEDSTINRTLTMSHQDGTISRSSCGESHASHRFLQVSQNSASENVLAQHSIPKPLQVHSIPKPLQVDLRIILSRLALPVHQKEDTMGVGQLTASILERIANLWIVYCSHESAELLPTTDVIAMLYRLLDCRDECPDHTSSDVNKNSNLYWTASASWLGVLNTHFMRIEDHRSEREQMQATLPLTDIGNSRHFDDTGNSYAGFSPLAGQRDDSAFDAAASLPGWMAVQFLPEFVHTALEMVQLTPWEPVELGDAVTETRVQWRILTGYLIEHTVQLQQQDELQLRALGYSTSILSEQWLHDRFREANPSVPSETIMGAVYDLLSSLTSYVTELTDYALDALDGAAVSFSSTTTTLTSPQRSVHASQKSQGGYCANEEQGEALAAAAMEAAEAAVQDSLRHVTLATNVLAAVEPWCGQALEQAVADTNHPYRDLRRIQQQQLVSLWKTMAASFMAKSNVSTVLNCKKGNSPHDVCHQNDFASRVCYHQLQLAELILSSSLEQQTTSNASGYESTLTLTFLRALDFPHQLLCAGRVWEAVAQRIQQCHKDRSHMDLKRTLQAAVLTLRHQHMLFAGGGGSLKQQGAQAIVDRLLPMLLYVPPSGTHEGTATGRTVDAWDGFFLRQLGSMTIGRKD